MIDIQLVSQRGGQSKQDRIIQLEQEVASQRDKINRLEIDVKSHVLAYSIVHHVLLGHDEVPDDTKITDCLRQAANVMIKLKQLQTNTGTNTGTKTVLEVGDLVELSTNSSQAYLYTGQTLKIVNISLSSIDVPSYTLIDQGGKWLYGNLQEELVLVSKRA